jgi:hypothetical protein
VADIEVKVNGIQVHLTAGESIWALKGDFFIPVTQIRGAEVTAGRGIFKSLAWALRVGTALPGVLYAGRFYRPGGKDFLMVRPGKPTLQINMDGKVFKRVLISIPDAEAKAEEINTALAAC